MKNVHQRINYKAATVKAWKEQGITLPSSWGCLSRYLRDQLYED